MLRAAGMTGGYRQKKWREAERVRVDVNALLGHALEGGILEEDVAGLVPRLTETSSFTPTIRRAPASRAAAR